MLRKIIQSIRKHLNPPPSNSNSGLTQEMMAQLYREMPDYASMIINQPLELKVTTRNGELVFEPVISLTVTEKIDHLLDELNYLKEDHSDYLSSLSFWINFDLIKAIHELLQTENIDRADELATQILNKIKIMTGSVANNPHENQLDYSQLINFLDKTAPGIDDNKKRARYWYILGLLHAFGIGTPVNLEEAYAYIKLATRLDNLHALTYLGWIYFTGRGVKVNKLKAEEYWSKCYERNHLEAFSHLASLYKDEGDKDNAFPILKKAANIKNGPALLLLHELRKENTSHPLTLTALQASVKFGTTQALLQIGEFYENSDQSAENICLAAYHYRLCITFGYRSAGLLALTRLLKKAGEKEVITTINYHLAAVKFDQNKLIEVIQSDAETIAQLWKTDMNSPWIECREKLFDVVKEYILNKVNKDGEFNLGDLHLLAKWILYCITSENFGYLQLVEEFMMEWDNFNIDPTTLSVEENYLLGMYLCNCFADVNVAYPYLKYVAEKGDAAAEQYLQNVVLLKENKKWNEIYHPTTEKSKAALTATSFAEYTTNMTTTPATLFAASAMNLLSTKKAVSEEQEKTQDVKKILSL